MVNDAKSHNVRRRKGSRHDKTGCLTCRYRRKKCTENTFPVCGTCARLNIKCVRDPVRNIVPATVRTEVDPSPGPITPSHPSPRLSPLSALPLTLVASTKSQSGRHRYAMKYYISELANHFTVSTEFNSFISDFLPMAIESPALCDALLALASSHISLVDESYAVVTLEAQTNAIRNLTTAINAPSDQITWHETNAATCLAFATSQISTSDGKGWFAHLQGAKHFITSVVMRPSSGETLCGLDAFKLTAEGRWILRNFAYHDIIGSVTHRRRPLLDASYLNDICQVVDSYLGVATSLLSYIGQISFLEDDTIPLEIPTAERTDAETLLHARCVEIEEEVKNWTCPPETRGELASMAYAYRSVVLILLYRLVRRRLTTYQGADIGSQPSPGITEMLEAKIGAQVAKTLEHVSEVPIGAAPEAALLFPLFIAGGEAREEDQMDVIRSRLRKDLEKRNFQNISRSLEILERLWFQRQVLGVESADWVQILEATGDELVLT